MVQKGNTMKRSFIREILEHTDSDTISFAGGLPDPALFPLEALRDASDKVLRRGDALQYAISAGDLPLRKTIAEQYTREGFATHPEEILITSGSQQGLDIISRHHAQNTITIERPSYLGALNLFALNRLSPLGTPLTNDGLDLGIFEKHLRRSSLAYLISDFQNPTGHRIDAPQRKEIARLLQKHNTLLVEDAPYAHLYFDHFTPSISSMMPHQSYHLGSFSKVLAPGLRIGWIRADATLIKPLIAIKEATDLHTASLTQQIVHAYLNHTDMHQVHLESLRKTYKEKMEYLADTLETYLPALRFIRPNGGMFLYGSLPNVNAHSLLESSLIHGVIFVPGVEFGGRADELRLNFTHSDFGEIEEGIKRIQEAYLSVCP
jgi:2-aminoadipate transaminase